MPGRCGNVVACQRYRAALDAPLLCRRPNHEGGRERGCGRIVTERASARSSRSRASAACRSAPGPPRRASSRRASQAAAGAPGAARATSSSSAATSGSPSASRNRRLRPRRRLRRRASHCVRLRRAVRATSSAAIGLAGREPGPRDGELGMGAEEPRLAGGRGDVGQHELSVLGQRQRAPALAQQPARAQARRPVQRSSSPVAWTSRAASIPTSRSPTASFAQRRSSRIQPRVADVHACHSSVPRSRAPETARRPCSSALG